MADRKINDSSLVDQKIKEERRVILGDILDDVSELAADEAIVILSAALAVARHVYLEDVPESGDLMEDLSSKGKVLAKRFRYGPLANPSKEQLMEELAEAQAELDKLRAEKAAQPG